MAQYITKQRKILQDYLSQHIDEELSAKKVAEDLSQQQVSLSAIYRNLAQMEKEQLVVQCHKEGSREFYFRYVAGADCQGSLHLSCKICNKILHISPEESSLLHSKILDEHGFAMDYTNTVFYGICKECRKIS